MRTWGGHRLRQDLPKSDATDFRKIESQWRGLNLSEDMTRHMRRTFIHCTKSTVWYDSLFRHGRSLKHMISYCPIWYHVLMLQYVYDIICYQIYKISNQWSHMSLIWYLGSWNFDITYTNLWYHMHYFIPYIKCLSHHMLELWYHIYEPMISDIWLHTLYHMFMKAGVGTMIS